MMASIGLVMLVVSVATTLVGLATGFGWVITRMDARFAESEQRTNLRFDKVDERFDRVDAEFDRVYAQFDRVYAQFDRIDERFRLVDSHFDRLEASTQELRSEVGDVKIGIARLEGPLPRLIVER